MANNNNMLTFGVGFDWSQAVDQKKAQEALDRAQRIVTNKPITFTATYDQSALKHIENAYGMTIDGIKSRLAALNEAWSKLKPKEIYDAATKSFSNKDFNVMLGSGENQIPFSINPAKAMEEIAQLTTALQTFGKTASQINQERIRALEEEQRALQRQIEAEQRRAEVMSRLSTERAKQQQAQASLTSTQSALDKATEAYDRQEKKVAVLERAFIRAKEAREKLEKSGGAKDAQGLNTDAYEKALKREEAASVRYTQATKDLTSALSAKISEEERWFNKSEQETAALKRQKDAVASLNTEITKTQLSRMYISPDETQLEKANRLVKEQQNAVANLAAEYRKAQSEREKYDGKGATKAAYDKDGFQAVGYKAALQAELKAGQDLLAAEQKLTERMSQRAQVQQRVAEQAQRDASAVANQKSAIDALVDSINKYQAAQAAIGSNETKLEKLTKSLQDQDIKVKLLRDDLKAAKDARVDFETKGTTNKSDGTANKAYVEALQKEEKLAKQLNTAEQQLLNTQQRRLDLLRQIGLSGNMEQYGRTFNIGFLQDQAAIDAEIQRYNQLKQTIATLGVEYERLKALHNQAGTDVTKDQAAIDILKQRIEKQKELDKVTRTADQAQAEMLRKQEALQSRIKAKERKRATAMVQRIAKLREEQKALALQENTINNIQRKLAALNSQKARTDFLGDPTKFKQLNDEINRLQKLLDQVNGKQEKAKKAAEEHTKSMEYQKGVLDRLIQRMAVYASFGAAVNFLKNVRETTAEFERQRIALGAIINDQIKGNALFSEIKAFALKSPLKIMDLTRYTKQVAAYRIETDKLFDTTKRLADVSVGLGVDMQRLVLAYGQVKAATYLRASELRQFTEAGIPMLELLSERFTQLEGQMVSTADVMKRISKRGVEFKEVEQVMRDMTDAGGMFYNMQEKIGNTLYGMWAKLGDAASIMYDQIGNTGPISDGMKALIRVLTEMMRNWKTVGRYATEVAVVLGAYKLWTMAAAVATKYYSTSLKMTAVEQNKLYLSTINHTRASKIFAATIRALGFSMGKAAAATAVFNRVLHLMKAAIVQTGIGVIILALGYLIDKLLFSKSAAEELKESLAKIDEESISEQSKSAKNFERLAETAVKAADGSKEQRDALDELQRTYKDIIPLEQMKIENLKAMNHDYSALTKSIKEYVAEQMKQKKIDTIIESTAKNIVSAEQDFKNKMSGVWSLEQVEAFLKAYEELLRENPTIAYSKAIQSAAKKIGASYQEIYDVTNAGVKVAVKSLHDYKDALVSQVNQINAIESAWTKGYEALGSYGRQFEALIKKAEAKPITEVGGVPVADTDYLFKQQQLNFKINDAIAPQLKKILKDAEVEWQDGWGVLMKEIDAAAPEMISTINFDLIEEYFANNVSSVFNKQYKAIQGLRKIYDNLGPSDKQTRIINERLAEIVLSVTGSVDKMSIYSRFLKSNSKKTEDWVKDIDSQRKEIDKQIKALEGTSLTASKLSLGVRNIFAAITGGEQVTIDDLKEQSKVLEMWLEPYKSLLSDAKSDKGKTREQIGKDKLQEWNEYSSVIESVYKKYEELQKLMSKEESLKHINEYYSDSLKLLKEQGLKLESFPKTAKEYQDALRQVRDQLQKTIKEYNLSAEWAAKKHVADIDVKIGTVDIDALKESYEDALKRLSNEIAQSKAAKDFFNNIFSQTKDYDMSMEMTMSIYGDTGENYQQQIIDQIRTAFGAGQDWEIDVSPAINVETGAVDYNELEKLMEAALTNEDLEKYREQMKKTIDEGRKFGAERAKQWAKDLSKAKTYAQQRVDLARYTAARISEIENDPGLSERAKTSLTNQYLARESKEAAKLEYEAFKDTPMYVQMFENLENATTASLEAMNKKLVELQKNLTDLDPTQLKEIQKRMEEIQSQLAERNLNPFGWLKSAAKEMKLWQTELQATTKSMGIDGYKDGIDGIKQLNDAISTYTDKQIAANEAVDNFIASDAYQAAVSNVETLQAIYDTMAAEDRESEQGLKTKEQLDAAKATLQNENSKLATLVNESEAVRKILEYLQGQVGAYNKIRAKQKEAWKGADTIKAEVDKVSDAAYEMAEAFGASEDALAMFQDVKTALNEVYDFTKSATDVIAMMSKTTVEGISAVEKASIILGVISAALKVATAIFNVFANSKARAKEREIQRQQKLIDALTYSYDKLSDATDKVFGSDYISNYNQRLENLQAQQAAAMKQAQLEREKGKKADADKIKEYEENARDAADAIAELQSEVAERMTGTDVASAAKDFADAWLDAYISFSSTAGAIKEKFNDMMKNMVVESAMAQIVQSVLQPFYNKISEAALSGGVLDAYEIVDLANQIPTYTDQITSGLQIFANQLESLGMDLHQLGETDEFTGIARDIASASEESITGLAAAINTQNYYISNVPLIYQEVTLIRQLLSGENPIAASRSPMLDTTDLQNEYLSHLPAIHTNTEAIAERCERAATACENIADNLSRVIKPRGVASSHVVNIS